MAVWWMGRCAPLLLQPLCAWPRCHLDVELLARWPGWVIDAFLMPYYRGSFNAARVVPEAPGDSSRSALCCKLPLVLLSLLIASLGVFIFVPSGLNHFNIVDLDKFAAQTRENPFDILAVSRSSTLSEVRAAYRKESLRWHPDRNLDCGKPCEDKMSEITKAFELIKRIHEPKEDWRFNQLKKNWLYILELIFKDDTQMEEGRSEF